MSTDFRKLCREMYDAFTAHARTDKQHDLLDRVQIALEKLPTKGSDNPWRDVLEDALVCAFLLNEENQSDPKKALRDLISWEIQLAKDPLINPPTQPVPVAERLPGPEDCDAAGRCWWGEPQIGDSHDATWSLCTQRDAEEFLTWGTKCGWLPATALPLPVREVE